MQYLLISAIALTLYDYLLMFDDEVRRVNLNARAPVNVLTCPFKDPLCLERPQDMELVPLSHGVGAWRADEQMNGQSFIYTFWCVIRVTSPAISRDL